jgi:hypothetical protein
MIYIKKEGLPDEINRKIIVIRKSNKWKDIEENDTKSIRDVFDNDFPKNDVKEILIHEQRGLCAYCMRRIRMDSHSRIEHWMPLSKDKDINETLLLNGIRKMDGSVRDTATEVLKGRRDAYDRARRMMVTLNNRGKCTSVIVKKKMDELYAKEERDEYVGVILYYLNKKYKSLVRRGL